MPERLLYLDPVGGLAGDMLVAALLDLGAPLEALRAGLDGLGFGPIPVHSERCRRGPFSALRFVVESSEDEHGEARCFADIRARLERANLSPRARARALAVFGRLAEAEGRVHGLPPDEVHFHEVGAVDSIADIVGACLLLEALDVVRLRCGPLPLGGGRVETRHGPLPLPAPATLALLEGWPVLPAPPGEWVTPTGAAFAAALCEPGALPAMRLVRVGHGAGSRDDGPAPNVLRALLGEDEPRPLAEDEVEVLEAALDDLSGTWFPALQAALFEAGALDVQLCQGIGKKGRPSLQITVLSPPSLAPSVGRALLAHSTSLGLRHRREARWVLPRRFEQVETPWGPVRMKVAEIPGQPERAAPEHEDCAALARAAGAPVAAVFQAALAAWAGRPGPTRDLP